MYAMLLSIDPGYARCGVAVFDETGKLIYYNLIETTSKLTFENRLLYIYNQLNLLINKYNIKKIIYEEPGKIFGRNSLLVPQVLGIINLISATNFITPIKYSPSYIKKIVTNSGDADKTFVEEIVVKVFDLSRAEFKQLFGDGRDDVYDAIAIGYCSFINIKNEQSF